MAGQVDQVLLQVGVQRVARWKNHAERDGVTDDGVARVLERPSLAGGQRVEHRNWLAVRAQSNGHGPREVGPPQAVARVHVEHGHC